MVRAVRAPSAQRFSTVRWTARMGAVTAEALADRQGTSIPSARSRLVAAEREGLVSRQRPLTAQPALYVITGAGLRACGLHGLGACRITPSNALHVIACAGVAVALEHCYPDHRLLSERELRCQEGDAAAPLASVRLGHGPGGRPLFHRPDLVLCPARADGGLPVAIEVELSMKAPRRLADICRAWARARHVAGVIYLAPPDVERALERAVELVRGGQRIVVAPLGALAGGAQSVGISFAQAITADP